MQRLTGNLKFFVDWANKNLCWAGISLYFVTPCSGSPEQPFQWNHTHGGVHRFSTATSRSTGTITKMQDLQTLPTKELKLQGGTPRV